MRVYDFKCPQDHVEEHVVKDHTVTEHPCHCGAIGVRQLSAPPVHLEGYSGSFPGAALKWEREHEKAGRGSHDTLE